MRGLRVGTTARGSGLFATEPFAAGTVIAPVGWAAIGPAPTRWTVQLDAERHAELLPDELRYMNHACDPNVHLDVDAARAVALRAIAPGDELTFDYRTTEWRLAEPFGCACGAACCAGVITGAAAADPADLVGRPVSRMIAAALARRRPEPV